MNCDIFKPKNNDTKRLKKVYADHHLTLVIVEPTRVTSDTRTLIDHIATNKPEHMWEGGRQGFMDRGFWTKLGMDYGFLTSSPLDVD